MRYSGREPDPAIVGAMRKCPYCGEHATVEIPAIPSRVCITHALEYWTGLLTYAKDRSNLIEPPDLSLVAPRFTETWRDLPIQ
jgi:hypothetical protein